MKRRNQQVAFELLLARGLGDVQRLFTLYRCDFDAMCLFSMPPAPSGSEVGESNFLHPRVLSRRSRAALAFLITSFSIGLRWVTHGQIEEHERGQRGHVLGKASEGVHNHLEL